LEAGRRLPPAVSCGYEIEEIAEILSFSPRWVRALLKRYNEGGAGIHNGTKPTIPRPVSARIHALRGRSFRL